MYLIRQKEEVASVIAVNEKIIVYLKSSGKLLFKNLFELYKWDSALFGELISQRFLKWDPPKTPRVSNNKIKFSNKLKVSVFYTIIRS